MHLLLRNRPQRKVLPTLRFLPESSQESMAMNRLKNLLLLLLRLALLMVLVAAFARPYFEQDQLDPEEGKMVDEGAVFALDTSLSMRTGNRWSMATDRVRTLMQTIRGKSSFSLLFFDRSPSFAITDASSMETIKMALKEREPGFGSTDLLAAIRAASAAASKLNAKQKRVYLISDFQNNGFKQITTELALPEGVELVPVPIAESSPWNAAVVAASERPTKESGLRRVRIQLSGYGAGEAEAELVIQNGKRRLASRKVHLQHNEGFIEDFDLALEKEKDYALEAVLEVKDGLDEDNTLAFFLEGKVPLPLLVSCPRASVALGGDAENAGVNPYLKAAVSAFGHRVDDTWIDPTKLVSVSLDKHKIALVDCVELYPQTARDALRKFVESGGSLILFPGKGAFAPLESFCGIRFAGWKQQSGTEDRYRLVSSTVPGGPFGMLGDAAGSLLGHPKAFRYLQTLDWEDSETARALAKFDDGYPFLIERRMGKGRVYLFTVPLDPKATDLVLSASFSPFLYQLIEYCSNQTKQKHSFVVGDAMFAADLGSSELEITKISSGETVLASFKSPGIYLARQDGSEYSVTVRLEPEESDLSIMARERIDLLAQTGRGGGSISGAMNLADVLEEVHDPDSSTRFWWYLLLAALCLMVMETLVASRTSR